MFVDEYMAWGINNTKLEMAAIRAFCRQNKQVKSEKSAVDSDRFQPLNGSIDSHSVNLSATNDDVNLQWHQQQRQQLVI